MSRDGRESDWSAESPPPWGEYGWPAAGQPDSYGAPGQGADAYQTQAQQYRNGPGPYETGPQFQAGLPQPNGPDWHEPTGTYRAPGPYAAGDPYQAPDPYGPRGRDELPGLYGPLETTSGSADPLGLAGRLGPADPRQPPAGRHTPDSYRYRRPEEPADSYPAPRSSTDSFAGSGGSDPGYRPGSHARRSDRDGSSGPYRPADPDQLAGQNGPPGQFGPAGQYGPAGEYGPAGQVGQPGYYAARDLDGVYGQNGASGRDDAYGRDGAYGQNGAPGRDDVYGQDGAYGQDDAYGQDGAYGQNGLPGQYGPSDGLGVPDRRWSPLDGPAGSDGSGPQAGYPGPGSYDPADQYRAAGPYGPPGNYREPDPGETQSYAIPERAWSPDPLSDGPQEQTNRHGAAAGPPWPPQAEPPWPPPAGRDVPGPGSRPGREQWPGDGYGPADTATAAGLSPGLDGPFRWQPPPGQPAGEPTAQDQDNTIRRPWSPGSAGHAGGMGAERDTGRHGRSRGGRRAARDQGYLPDGFVAGSQSGSQADGTGDRGGGPDGYPEPQAGGYRNEQPAEHSGGFRAAEPDGYPDQWPAGYPEPGGTYSQQDADYLEHRRDGRDARRGSRGGRPADASPEAEDGPPGGFFGDLGGEAQVAKPKRGRGWLAAVLALVVIVAAGSGAAYGAWKWWEGRHGNYTGSGTGQVIVQVQSGEYPAQLAPALVRLGVIKTTQPFIDAAKLKDPTGLEPGYFRLHKHMNAALAWALLLNPKSRVQSTVTIPDGLRASSILALLATKTGIPLAKYQQALKETGALGLPPYANGNPEGYLFPATYSLPPNATALSVLQMMVQQYNSQAASLGLATNAKRGQLTEAQVITEASIVEAEVNRVSYYPMVAKVIDNRLNDHMMLGLDSTIAYAVNKYTYNLTASDLKVNSPYNTFLHQGLPPGPIDSPDAAAINAVLHPAPGDWTYFVTVNPKTGLTYFTNSYAQFQVWANEARHNGA